ncbi:MAG: ABC transporter substrate-binding protein [Pseudomonadota bacterium]
MVVKRRAVLAALALAASASFLAGPAAAQDRPIRVAVGDIASIEILHMLIAFERAKQRGLKFDITYFKAEDIATQAVINGQADIGVGTPYPVQQKTRAPIRIFYQLVKLRFNPVVSGAHYKTWKDLDGQDMVVHTRGSGTEAMAKLMAKQHGIAYKSLSYVPGSEVRGVALLQGNIRATFLDNTNTKLVLREAPGKFVVLPITGVSATDESLFATLDYIQKNPQVIQTLTDELVPVWRAVLKDQTYVVAERAKYKLLPDLPANLEGEVVPYFKDAVEAGILPPNGGGERAARDDFAFYTLAGQLQGSADDLKVADFWYLDALNRTLDRLGRLPE